ncbi:MAG: winged helix-turn-helix transcriptional regulator [Candidatus Helarchaeota archaeon]
MKRRTGTIFALTILCAMMIWNIIYIGAVLVTNTGSLKTVDRHPTATFGQNVYLIVNDMPHISSQSTSSVGIISITQAELQVSNGLILSAFFIYFIIATNVQDYNLFPSQAKLNQSTRQKIYELIESNEGIHLREICRLLDKKMGVIQYHVHILENSNLVSSMKDGRYKRFFVNHQDSPEEQMIISLLKRETTAKVLVLIYENNGAGISHSAIANQLKSTSQAITWHIHKLSDARLIITTKKGCQKFYQIAPNYLPQLESVLKNYT